ncbi:hypothetical protein [Streptomyces sp. bgisy153]|uniref:hypothetical protein n=1 Tax=Streptomyces sp. bgisy153 TaxID=3413793 RepID=UPI003D73170F
MLRDETSTLRLTLPAAPPLPVPGCGECARLDRARAVAGRAGDRSRVSDCNVLISLHPHAGQ